MSQFFCYTIMVYQLTNNVLYYKHKHVLTSLKLRTFNIIDKFLTLSIFNSNKLSLVCFSPIDSSFWTDRSILYSLYLFSFTWNTLIYNRLVVNRNHYHSTLQLVYKTKSNYVPIYLFTLSAYHCISLPM